MGCPWLTYHTPSQLNSTAIRVGWFSTGIKLAEGSIPTAAADAAAVAIAASCVLAVIAVIAVLAVLAVLAALHIYY